MPCSLCEEWQLNAEPITLASQPLEFTREQPVPSASAVCGECAGTSDDESRPRQGFRMDEIFKCSPVVFSTIPITQQEARIDSVLAKQQMVVGDDICGEQRLALGERGVSTRTLLPRLRTAWR